MTEYQKSLIRAAVDGLTSTGLIVTVEDYDTWARYIAFQIVSKKEMEMTKKG